jgi:hypothetical protein
VGQLWQLLRDTACTWYEDRAQRLGAALAFYTIFALAPGLVILIAVSGLVLDPETAEVRIVEQIETLIGRTGTEAIEATLVSAREQGTGVTLVAVVTFVLGLWWVFGELQNALNTIWGVTPAPERTARSSRSCGSGSGPSLSSPQPARGHRRHPMHEVDGVRRPQAGGTGRDPVVSRGGAARGHCRSSMGSRSSPAHAIGGGSAAPSV